MGAADVVGLDPVYDLGEAPDVVAAEGGGHLGSLKADGCVGVDFADPFAELTPGVGEGDVHEGAVVGPGGVVLALRFLALLDLVGGHSDDVFPAGEAGVPLCVETVEGAVLVAQPVSKRGEGEV